MPRNRTVKYNGQCPFTGRSYLPPASSQFLGLDAHHVVPDDSSGSDHPANGNFLSKDLHRAFDRGLIGVSPMRLIIVPNPVQGLKGNGFLVSLHGKPTPAAKSPHLSFLDTAVDFHPELSRFFH
jgi:putative restriction endonuclease